MSVAIEAGMGREEAIELARQTARRRRFRLTPGFIAMSLVTIFVGLLVLFPLSMLLFGSFWTARPGFDGSLTLDHYIRAYSDPGTYRVFGTTLLLMGAKTILAVFFAVSMAWIVTRTDTPMRGMLEVLLTIPLFVPGLLEAIGWILLLSPNTGVLNVFLRNLFGLSESPFNIYSLGGMLWVLSVGSTSFIFLLMVNALRNMDASLEESSRASGAGPIRTAISVTMPLMAPAILGAGMLSFIRAMETFEVPVLLGLPAKVFVFSNRIYAAVQYDYPVNYGLATSLGVSFVALTFGLLMMQNKLLGGRSFFVITGKGYKPHIIRLGVWKYVTFAVCLGFFLISTGLPLSQLLITSVMPNLSVVNFSEITFKNYLQILSDVVLWRSFVNTLVVCGGSALLAVTLCSIVSYISTRTNYPGRKILDTIAWLPWAIPGVVAGLGMLWAYISVPGLKDLYGSLWLLVLVFLTTGLPLGVRLMSGVMVQLGKELEESSRVLGAGWGRTFWTVVLPLLRPAFAGAVMLLFIGFSRAVSSTILFTGPGNELLAVTLFSYSQAGRLETVSALAIVLLLINGTGLLIARRLGAFGRGAAI
ncbi:MAG TPA: iron ABC transporter permease [Chloroflexota bacterium]|nr:iron ABC transporter permease [Chloroflexota bacterium]